VQAPSAGGKRFLWRGDTWFSIGSGRGFALEGNRSTRATALSLRGKKGQYAEQVSAYLKAGALAAGSGCVRLFYSADTRVNSIADALKETGHHYPEDTQIFSEIASLLKGAKTSRRGKEKKVIAEAAFHEAKRKKGRSASKIDHAYITRRALTTHEVEKKRMNRNSRRGGKRPGVRCF